jgi:hypothetical protein
MAFSHDNAFRNKVIQKYDCRSYSFPYSLSMSAGIVIDARSSICLEE